MRASEDVGASEAEARVLWGLIMKKGKPDATEAEMRDEALQLCLRKSARFAEKTKTHAEHMKAEFDAAGPSASWLLKHPMAEGFTQAEALQHAIEALKGKLPMEKASLQTQQCILNATRLMKTAASEKELDEMMDGVKTQVVLLNQLVNSMRAATSELSTLVKRRKTIREKAQEKKKTEVLKAQQEQGDLEKLRLQKKRKMDPFHLDFAKVGLRSCVTLPTPSSATEDHFAAPWLLEGYAQVGNLCTTDGTQLAATLERWKKLFPETKQCKSHGAVIAPLAPGMGHDEPGLLALCAALAPESIDNVFPRYSAAVSTWFLYGESDMMIATDFEAEMLGCLRVQLGGVTQFYGMPLTAIMDAMQNPRLKSGDEFKSFLSQMTQERLQLIAEKKLQFVHGCVRGGQVLVIPPGWVMSYASVGDGPEHFAFGLRKSFLSRWSLGRAKAQYDMCLSMNISEKNWIQFLETLVDVELKVLPSSGGKTAKVPELSAAAARPAAAGTVGSSSSAQGSAPAPAPAPRDDDSIVSTPNKKLRLE